MFCKNCGTEMIENHCPMCGSTAEETTSPVVENSPVNNETANYQTAAKKYWYCFLLPILFFIPLLNENKKIAGNTDVANNTLWLLIINIAISIISGFLPWYLSVILSLLSFALFIFIIVAAVSAYKGKAIKVPVVGDIKIIK